MIRSALIALGLCAGAASAQAGVLAAPILDLCADAHVVLTVDEQSDTGHAQADDVADSHDDGAVLPKETAQDGVYFAAGEVGRLQRLQDVVDLTDLKVAPTPAADGSDPSADFCP